MRKVVFSFAVGIVGVSGISDDRLELLLQQTPGLRHEVFLETLDKSQNKLTSSGRRRTVQDKDCDDLVDAIDSIEDNCSRFRYSVFQNLYPQLMQNAISDSTMLGRTASINDSFTGGLVSVMRAAIRDTFNTQRDSLYGPNGTCTSPKKGGLAATVDSLAGTVFSLVNKQKSAYDTAWKNVQGVDKFMTSSFTDESAKFANITGTVMSTMNQFQARLFKHQDRSTADFINTLNLDYLNNVSQSINMMSGLIDDGATQLDANYTDFHKIVDPMVNDMLDQLDKLSDQFIHADDDFANVIQSVGDKMNPVLTAVPGKEASDPINSLRSSNLKSIKDFESASNGFVNSSSTDWTNSFKTQMQSAGLGQMQRQTSIDNAADQIDSMFTGASDGMDGNYTVAVGNIKKKIEDVRAMAKDMRATVWTMSSKLHNVKGSLQTMFDALAGVAGDAAGDLRKRLAELMSSTGEASSDQLKVLLSDFSNLQNQLGGSGNAQRLKMMAALGNVREMVGRGGTSEAGASANLQDSLSAQADYSSKQANSVGSTQSALVGDASKTLMQNSAGTAAGLYSTSTDMQSQQSGASRDMRSAVAGQSDVVTSGMAANDLQASQTRLGIVSAISANASNIDAAAGSAGQALGQTEGAVAASLSSITTVNQLAAKAGSDSANAAASLGSQLGRADDALADQYAKNSRAAYAGVTGKADSSETAAASALGQQASGLSDNLKVAVADGDQKAGAAKSSIMQGLGAAEDSASDLGVLGDSIDGLISGSGSKADSTVRDANSTLSGSLLGALASVQTVGSKVTASNLDSESKTSVEAGKVVNAALSAFQGKASNIVSQSSVYSDRVAKAGPKLAGTDSALAQGLDLIKSNMKLALATVSDIASTMPAGGGSVADEAVMDLKRSVADASSLLSTNISALAAAVAKVTLNVSSGVGLPDDFQTSLTSIVEETLANSDKINQIGRDSYNKMLGMSAGASNDSVAVLSDLDSIGQTWQNSYSSAIRQGAATSRERVGEFGGLADDATGIANLMSAVQANRGKISQSSRQLSDMTDSQLQLTVGQLMGSVQATKGSLSRASSSAGAQAAFNSQVDNGSAGKFLQALQQEAQLSDSATASSATAMKESTGRASMDIHDMESKLAADQQARQARMAHALSAVSGMDSDFTKNISGNKDAIAIQLLMARRAVRDILNSWTGYSDYETKKFEKMAATDEEYIQMSQRNLDNSESESHAKLIDSKARMDTLNTNLGDVLTDYMSFSNSTTGQLGLLSEVVPLLNVSATGSITQLSESAFSFDKADVQLDVAARNETMTALADFEASLDRHANMAISAANGNLLPALSAGAY